MVVVMPPIPLPGRQPFEKFGVPPMSTKYAITPKQPPIDEVPVVVKVCFGR